MSISLLRQSLRCGGRMLLYVLKVFEEVLGCYMAFSILFGIRVLHEKKNIIVLFFVSIFVAAIYYYLFADKAPGMLAPIIAIMVSYLMVNWRNAKKVVFFPFAFFIFDFSAVVISLLLSMILKMNQLELINTPKLVCIVGALSLLGWLFPYILRNNWRGVIQIYNKGQYIVLFSGCVCIYMLYGLAQFVSNAENIMMIEDTNILLLVFLLFGVLFLTVFLWQQVNFRKIIEYQHELESGRHVLREQEAYIKGIIENGEKRKKVMHDMKGHILSLKGYAEAEEWEKLKKYLYELNQEVSSGKIDNYTGIAAVDAIIMEYKNKASSEKIAWNFTGKVYQRIDIEDYDLCKVLYNILSNAYEAAIITEGNRYIYGDICVVQGRLVIQVRNSSLGGGNLLTTKEDKENHGYGIKIIQEIVAKHNGSVEYGRSENEFRIRVLL